ncbi:MAG: hypothetical protein ACLSFZ_08075 [Frisingicoccus sp.]
MKHRRMKNGRLKVPEKRQKTHRYLHLYPQDQMAHMLPGWSMWNRAENLMKDSWL